MIPKSARGSILQNSGSDYGFILRNMASQKGNLKRIRINTISCTPKRVLALFDPKILDPHDIFHIFVKI